MFCPNCGEELRNSNQSFCHYCGSELSATTRAPQIRTERIQEIPPVYSPSTPEIAETQFIVQKPFTTVGIGPNSKKCLAFAIVSIGLAVAAWIVGFNVFFWSFVMYWNDPPTIRIIVGVIVAISLNVVGLVFGTISRVNKAKARNMESPNTVEKLGGAFGIVGICMNAVLMVVGFIFLSLAIMASRPPLSPP